LVVNSVIATDICDKDLKVLRNARWDKAFNKAAIGASSHEQLSKSAADAALQSHEDLNRKATIVIEHSTYALVETSISLHLANLTVSFCSCCPRS